MADLTKIGVIGAGMMGAGIAQKIAQDGCEVILADVSDEVLKRSIGNIDKSLQEGVQRKIMSEDAALDVMSRIRPSTDLKPMSGCQLIIEAVVEDIALKREIFGELDAICPRDTIFATNTSTLAVNEIASGTKRPDRFVGLHFFYHAAKNRLLEVIFLPGTSPHARAVATSISNLMGKTALHVTDAPGFAVNRFFIPWSMEAFRLFDEAVGDIPSIDHVVRETFGGGMGPFEFMNATRGFTLACLTSSTLRSRISPFYGPAAVVERKLKSGGLWDLSGDPKPETFDRIRDRLLGAVFFVASSLVNEGVTGMAEVDIGARVGLRWKSGPFELMNAAGIDRTYNLVKEIVGRNPDLMMPSNLEEQHRKGQAWDIRHVTWSKEGNAAAITIKRPEVMNALNGKVFAQLGEALDEIHRDPSIRAVVLGGMGKDFVAGADIGNFIQCIRSRRFDELQSFGAQAREVARRIDNSDKLTIARVQGLALGGGLELALACDAIVASEKAAFGFPETSIGIIPGLGGMPRSMRKIGKPLAKYLVLGGPMISAQKALSMGLVDHVAHVADLDERIKQLIATPSLLEKKPPSGDRDPEFTRIEEEFSDANVQKVIHGEGIEDNELRAKLHKQISFKAPLAIKTANRVMDEGEKLPLEMALDLESAASLDLFMTADALEGLLSVGKGKPKFLGK
ncbi:MAG: 3-hydroxyacyl-CoA dehydrogenase/enoyl-CoA hydratase family protein [Desulfobacteraceae bacterium]|nr:MAG: 3-hydroxyacyl-CoA dehydrogenase/enoyl-CoA hydratase family protein [Desulfobacteraceae bacterium]